MADAYTEGLVAKIKERTGAREVRYSVLGVTLVFEGHELLIGNGLCTDLGQLIHQGEIEVLRRAREELRRTY